MGFGGVGGVSVEKDTGEMAYYGSYGGDSRERGDITSAGAGTSLWALGNDGGVESPRGHSVRTVTAWDGELGAVGGPLTPQTRTGV